MRVTPYPQGGVPPGRGPRVGCSGPGRSPAWLEGSEWVVLGGEAQRRVGDKEDLNGRSS